MIMVGCWRCTYPSIHVEDTLKITVGCPLCTFPSIHLSLDEDTLEITVGCLTSSISKRSQKKTLKITVGCLTSAYPSIHLSPCAGTLKITVGCPLCTYPSVRNKKLALVLDSLDQAGNTRAVGTSTRAVACAFTGGPQPRLFEFAPL